MKPLTVNRNGQRVPNWTATQPDIGIAMALATMKLVNTQVIESLDAPNAACICGIATLAMVMSTNWMSEADMTATVTSQYCNGGNETCCCEAEDSITFVC